jgi:hypothetical protein
MLITYRVFVCLCLSILVGYSVSAQREILQLGKVKLEFTLDGKGEPVYSVTYGDKPVILPSAMGFRLKEGDSLFSAGFVVTGVDRKEMDTTWEPVWGETKRIRDHHKEMRVHLRQTGSGRLLDVVFRAFEDGVGFRYVFPRQSGLKYCRAGGPRPVFCSDAADDEDHGRAVPEYP